MLHRVKCGKLRSRNSGVYGGRRCTSLVDQQFSYVRLAAPLLVLDTAGISTQFCFTYSPGGGVTAVLRGLLARLCHAFSTF